MIKATTNLLLPLFIMLLGCGNNFRQSKTAPSFRKSNYILKAFWAGKFDDNYLNFKENGYFERYKKMFGITKINHQNGVYIVRDTILLMCSEKKFDSTKIAYVGFMDTAENIIRFVTKEDNYVEHYHVEKGSLKKLLQTIKK